MAKHPSAPKMPKHGTKKPSAGVIKSDQQNFRKGSNQGQAS